MKKKGNKPLIKLVSKVFKSTFLINDVKLVRILSNHDRSPNDLRKDKKGV